MILPRRFKKVDIWLLHKVLRVMKPNQLEYHYGNLWKQLDEIHVHLSKMRSAMCNRRGPILLHDNVWLHVNRMTWQKLLNLGYEILPHTPYSSNLSSTEYHFFKHLDTFYDKKTFLSKGEAETALKDFSASKPLVLSYWHEESYFDRLKRSLNSLIRE